MGFLPWKIQYYLAIFLSIRPCEKRMEDDDGFIQVPEKHPLQREQEQVRAEIFQASNCNEGTSFRVNFVVSCSVLYQV